MDLENLRQLFLPIVVSYSVLGSLGILGNVFTIKFYSNASTTSTTLLIKALAISDLVICFTLPADYMQLLFGDYKQLDERMQRD